MSDEKQAVTEEADEQSKQTAPEAETDARDDLEGVLAEYDKETSEPEQKGESEEKSEDDPIRQYVERAQQRELQQDIEKAVEIAKGERNVSTRVVRALLNDKAQEDQRFLRAFQERHSNPKGWERALKAFGSELDSELGSDVDKAATEDTAAVRQAVRGSSTKTSEPDEVPDFRGKSDAEFQRWVTNQIR